MASAPHRHIYKTTTKMCEVKVLNEFVLTNMRKRALIHSYKIHMRFGAGKTSRGVQKPESRKGREVWTLPYDMLLCGNFVGTMKYTP